MKNLETTKQNKQTESTSENLAVAALEFGDVVVYNEMSDQTSVKLNLIAQIHAQLNQLDEMNSRRQFVMKEILQQIVD